MGRADLPAPPRYFVGLVEPWLEHRQRLVTRCRAWNAAHPAPRESPEAAGAIEDEAGRLFPPPAFSDDLAAGSRWSCVEGLGPPAVPAAGLVVVTVGGIFGGSDGPAGLFDYVAGVLSGAAAFLQLDAGHDAGVAREVLRAGLRWLLATHPGASGRIVLAGFSMGSAAAIEVGAEFLHAVRGVLLIAGQTAGTERICCFAGKAVLLVHGQDDPCVPVHCSHDLAAAASAAGAAVQLEVFPPGPCQPATPGPGREHQDGGMLERLRRHHLWDQRWDVQAVVLQWLRDLLRDAGPATRAA